MDLALWLTLALPDGRQGHRWSLRSGKLVVVRPTAGNRLTRPVGVVLGTGGTPEAPVMVQPFPGFWIGVADTGHSRPN